MIPFLVFLFGISIGSFLNAAIFRTHEDRSVWKGRSECMQCKAQIAWYDLFPVVSFLNLRGRCRTCKAPLDWQYPTVELVTGLLFVIAYVFSPFSLVLLLRNWVFIAYLVLIFVYDLRYMYILDRFTIPAMVCAFVFNLLLGTLSIPSLLIGGLLLGGFFLVQFVLSKGTWVGGGDIRLGALMGLMLGAVQGLVALFLAYLIGAAFSIVLLLMKKADRKTPLPFGIFLTTATIITLFIGQHLLDWYLGFFR